MSSRWHSLRRRSIFAPVKRAASKKPVKLDMDTIAAHLGVSKTTVHYAIRNTGRLGAETRKRVLKLVQALGYRPDGLARSFRRRRTDTLGVVMVMLNNSMHARTLEGLESVARAQGYAILVTCSHGSPQVEREMVEVLLEKGVDGIVVTPTDPVENRDYYRALIERGVRLVLVDREIPGLNVDCVFTDNEAGGRLEAEHLVSLGRRKLLYLATRPPQRRSTAVRKRLRGVNRALKEAKLRPATVLATNPPDWAGHEHHVYDVMRAYLKHATGRFDAVCAAHDDMAYGAIRALTEAHLPRSSGRCRGRLRRSGPQRLFSSFPHHDPPAGARNWHGGRPVALPQAERPRRRPRAQRIVLEPTLIIRESSGDPRVTMTQ